jgi:hypothetical protein
VNAAQIFLLNAKDELTEDEKFWLCVAAGVKTECKTVQEGEKTILKMWTTQLCGVYKLNGEWCVAMREDKPGPTLQMRWP